MAVAFKVNSPERSRTDLQSKAASLLDEGIVLSNSYSQPPSDLSVDEVVDSLGQQYRSALIFKTSAQGRASDLRKIAIQSELLTSLLQDPIFGFLRRRGDSSSVLLTRNKASQFDEAYAKLGRWRLKGTDELNVAENTLLSSKRNFYLLAANSLDEDDVEVFNHVCWLLSRKPMASARILTAELVRRIAGHESLTVDQWTNGLEALLCLPERCRAIFAPSIRHILLAATREKDEDIISAASKLVKGLPIETIEDQMAQWRVVARESVAGESFVSGACINPLSPDK
jgi:hypothetical protein